MKALTISQPYASLIADGEKWIENRTWETRYRGRLAIHAGKGTQYLDRTRLADYPTGVVLATCDLVACFSLQWIEFMAKKRPKIFANGTERYWSEIARHQHAEGPWCWVLQHVERLPVPIAASGKQGLWEWTE